MNSVIVIFLTIIYLFVPVLGGLDPRGLGKYAGLLFVFAIAQILIELFILERIGNKGGEKSAKSLRVRRKIIQ